MVVAVENAWTAAAAKRVQRFGQFVRERLEVGEGLSTNLLYLFEAYEAFMDECKAPAEEHYDQDEICAALRGFPLIPKPGELPIFDDAERALLDALVEALPGLADVRPTKTLKNHRHQDAWGFLGIAVKRKYRHPKDVSA